MPRLYRYIGPDPVSLGAGLQTPRWPVEHAADVTRLLDEAGGRGRSSAALTCTFVVDAAGCLFAADRRSEHVACARGGLVTMAGEIRFECDGRGPFVAEATNQSTGYCPEPSSWPALAAALDRAGLRHPGAFTAEFVFRRCDACAATNLVKDDWFVCGACDAPLAQAWNFDAD